MSPKLIQLSHNLTIAYFELMKLIPAKHTLMKAMDEGKIQPDYPIIETSSGTYAQGLAIVCRELNIPFIIVSDPIISPSLRSRLNSLGGKVQIIERSVDNLNIQTLRLSALKEHLARSPQSYWPAQYDNPENRRAYSSVGQTLLNEIPQPFTLVGAVGSGGSTCGISEEVRRYDDRMKLVGVDTFGSVLFGLPAGPRKLRGLGNSLMPKNVVHKLFDEVHWVSAKIAYKALWELHSQTGIYAGPTTGAAFHVARWIARNHPSENFVFIGPDSGHRYTDTVYNLEWLKSEGVDINKPYPKPLHAVHLKEVQEEWTYFNWNRQSYEKVLSQYG